MTAPAPTAGPAFTLTYTYAPAGGDIETRTYTFTDEALATDQLAAARRLQQRQGNYRDAKLIPAPAAPTSLLGGILATTRGCEKFFAHLAA